MSDLEVVREGPVHFFSKGIGNSWKPRYLVVTRAGVCDIFMDERKKKRHNKKKGGGFHLQGGETVEVYEPKDKTVNYAFQIVETKKTWQFATENEKLRDEWIIALKNVLKQLVCNYTYQITSYCTPIYLSFIFHCMPSSLPNPTSCPFYDGSFIPMLIQLP